MQYSTVNIWVFLAHHCFWNPGSVTACSGSALVRRTSATGGWTARSTVLPEYPTPETRPLSECPRSCKHAHNASLHITPVYRLVVDSTLIYILFYCDMHIRLHKGGRIKGMSVLAAFMPSGVYTVCTWKLFGVFLIILQYHVFASSAVLMLHPFLSPVQQPSVPIGTNKIPTFFTASIINFLYPSCLH